MITKTFGVDFYSADGALTLPSELVGHSMPHVWKIHSSGWAIRGEIKEDWSDWVNEFEAVHPVFGKVWGDFDKLVYADSEEAFEHFFGCHTPEAWDYQDI